MRRRDFIKSASLGLLASGIVRGTRVFAQNKPVAFDHAWLASRARALAAKPYVKRSRELPKALVERDWDQFHFRPERALWSKLDSRFAVEFFHRSKLFRDRIDVFEVVNGRATPVTYDPGMFDYARSDLRADALPRDIGFAGLRLTFDHDPRDLTSFLGASYFRAVAGNFQWGLSARGLAVNSGMPGRTEEFPMFTCFWLERPAPGAGSLIIHALLESESITGAYRFAITPGATQVMDIDATLYPRKPIDRLGIAPGTSMFQCGENDKRMAYDVRPEIHDSDGLAMWTGNGEWIWRPLTNPAEVSWNAFVDQKPRGFGLLQRVVDFTASAPPPSAAIEQVVLVSRGAVELARARVLQIGDAAGRTRYRAIFDVVPPDDSTAKIEIRMFLRSAGQPLTETWLYHWVPPAANDRKLH